MDVHFMFCFGEIFEVPQSFGGSLYKMHWVIISNWDMSIYDFFGLREYTHVVLVDIFSLQVWVRLQADDCSYSNWVKLLYVFCAINESPYYQLFVYLAVLKSFPKIVSLVLRIENRGRFPLSLAELQISTNPTFDWLKILNEEIPHIIRAQGNAKLPSVEGYVVSLFWIFLKTLRRRYFGDVSLNKHLTATFCINSQPNFPLVECLIYIKHFRFCGVLERVRRSCTSELFSQ